LNYVQGIIATREQSFMLNGVSFTLRYLPFTMRWEMDFDNKEGVEGHSLRVLRGSLLELFKRRLGFDLVCGGNFDVPFMIDDFENGTFWIEVIEYA